MLIPKIPDLNIKTVFALLNSEVLRYYYKVQFADVKILKSNLIKLPLPAIDSKTQSEIEVKVDEILNGCIAAEKSLQLLIYDCYQLSENDVHYIKRYL